MATSAKAASSIQLEKLNAFSHFSDSALKWPNSAAVFADGRVAVADGGNNRICIFSRHGEPLWEHNPGTGFGPQHVREPIYIAVSPDQYLFVSDWHNHRFLVFDPDLNFSHTLFHLGPIHKGRGLHCLELFLKHLMTKSVGAPYYFTYDKMQGQQPKKADYSPVMLLRGLAHYLLHPGQALKIFTDRELSVRKPNGMIFQGDQIVITQKANRCLSGYKVEGKGYQKLSLIRHAETYPGGEHLKRLCNLAQDDDHNIYVCDQNNWIISIFDQNLEYKDRIEFEEKDNIPMAPFGCAILDNTYIAAARSFGLEIKRLSDHETVYEDSSLGETHGCAWDPQSRLLYYVDRSNSCIVQFKVPELS